MEFVLFLTNDGKVVHIGQVWIRQSRKKAATSNSGNSFIRNHSQEQQLGSSSYQRTQPLVSFPPTPANDQKSELNFIGNWITFPLHEAMCNYIKTQVSSYVPTKFAVFSILHQEGGIIWNCGQSSKKTVFSDYIVHFIDREHRDFRRFPL